MRTLVLWWLGMGFLGGLGTFYIVRTAEPCWLGARIKRSEIVPTSLGASPLGLVAWVPILVYLFTPALHRRLIDALPRYEVSARRRLISGVVMPSLVLLVTTGYFFVVPLMTGRW